MSLDADVTTLTAVGTLTVHPDGSITAEGFSGKNASCRDVAVLAVAWAIGELQRELVKAIEQPGNNRIGIA